MENLSDLTLEQLYTIIRKEIRAALLEEHSKLAEPIIENDLSNFPVDDLGPWPDNLTLRREEMYNDDGR